MIPVKFKLSEMSRGKNQKSRRVCGRQIVRRDTGYNVVVRKKSSIDREKQLERIERARRMTPEERLSACVNISRAVLELQLSGKQRRSGVIQKSHS
jgi:hypothetical protein